MNCSKRTANSSRPPGSFFIVSRDSLSRMRTLSGTAIRVWLAIAARADSRTGECWPSASRIAADAGTSRRSVERVIPELRRIGLLEVISGRGCLQPNVYRLPLSNATSGIPTGLSVLDDTEYRQGCRINTDKAVGEIPTEPSNRTRRKELDHGTKRKCAAGAASHEYSEAFEKFWSTYPRHAKKPAAFRAFKHACRETSADDIIAAAGLFAESDAGRVEMRFRPHPGTWLKDKQYLDDPADWNHGSRKGSPVALEL